MHWTVVGETPPHRTLFCEGLLWFNLAGNSAQPQLKPGHRLTESLPMYKFFQNYAEAPCWGRKGDFHTLMWNILHLFIIFNAKRWKSLQMNVVQATGEEEINYQNPEAVRNADRDQRGQMGWAVEPRDFHPWKASWLLKGGWQRRHHQLLDPGSYMQEGPFLDPAFLWRRKFGPQYPSEDELP